MSAVARRRALAAAIVAGVVAVVVALLVTGGSGSSRPIADGAARLVPGDALVWVHVSTDGDRDAVRRAEAVAARFPSYARLRGSVLSRLSVGGAGLGRWLGREAGLALLDSPSGTAASLVVLSVRDRGAARRFLGTGAPAETYRGVRLLRYGTVEAGLVGSYVVVGQSDALHRAVDLAQGRGDPLATSGAYRRAMAGLPADRVADAFVTAGGVRRLLDPAGGLLGAMGTLLDRPGLQAAGLSLSADAPGARLVVHKLSSPGGASAFPPFAPALAGEVPSGVLAYVGVRGFDTAIERLLGTASGALAQVAARVRPLLAPLHGEVALFLTSHAPAPILTVTAAGEQATLQRTLAGLGGRHTKVGATDVTVLHAGAVQLDAAAVRGRLVLSTAPQGIAAALARKGSLTGDASFRRVIGPVSGRLSSLIFLDFDQLLRLGEQTGLNDSRAYRAVREDLRQVRAVGARSTGGGGDTTAEIRFELR